MIMCQQFVISIGNSEFPTFQKLDTFVNDRCLALQLASSSAVWPTTATEGNKMGNSGKLNMHESKLKIPKQTALLANSTKTSGDKHKAHNQDERSMPCFVCKNGDRHHLLSCLKYDVARAAERAIMLKNWSGSLNCLSSHHRMEDCKLRWHCRFCKERHHASLHQHVITPNTSTNEPLSTTPGRSLIGSSLTSTCETHVVLGTVVAEIQDARGRFPTISIVVDSGSQYSFMTKKCFDWLGLTSTKFPKKASGIGQTIFEGANGKTAVMIRPIGSHEPELHTEVIVVTAITSYLPTVSLPYDIQARFLNYTLADPKFW